MSDQDYQRIARAIHYLRESALEQPALEKAAEHIGLSPYHFQRLFKRYAGVSPKRFLQHLTCEHAKKLLRASESILETSFAVGLSSPGRLHDLLINAEGVTPGEYKSGGAGVSIQYGVHSTPYGYCLLGLTERGICRLAFIEEEERENAEQPLKKDWPKALLQEDIEATGVVIQQVFYCQSTAQKPINLVLRGTNFQLKVWQALLRIPVGAITSYGSLANRIGQPTASRAVGTAIGQNPVGYLIPCHRVLRGDGGAGGYRWGIERKLAILGRELCRAEA